MWVSLLCGLVAFSLAYTAAAQAARNHPSMSARYSAPSTSPSSPTYPLSGTAEEYDGTLLDDAGIGWGWYDPDAASWSPVGSVYHYGGWAYTDSKGRFSISAVTAHPGHDEIEADGPFSADIMNNPTPTDPGLMNIGRWGLDFSTLGSITLRPGRVQVDIANVPKNKYLLVTLGDPATGLADSLIAPGGVGLADCPPPDFTSAVAQPAPSDSDSTKIACEWISPNDASVTATAGALTAGTVAMDWSTAVHGHLLEPASQLACRPGDVLRYGLWHVPVGQQFSFVGFSAYGGGTTTAYSPVITSAAVNVAYAVSLRVPASAPVGQAYAIEAYRSDDPYSELTLSDQVEVCRFAASRTTITRGRTVILSGRIDGVNATLLAARPGTARPIRLSAPGWKRVASLRLTANGSFHCRVGPRRSTTYVVCFSNPTGYFTPLVTVRVK